MPYEFLLSKACTDFWIIEKINKPAETRTMVDIVRGYQIREESESETESDDDNLLILNEVINKKMERYRTQESEAKTMERTNSNSSIVELN